MAIGRRELLAGGAGLLAVAAGCTTGGSDPEPPDPGGESGGGDRRSEWTVTAERVIDGDTFEARFPDGHAENVRLLGVDAPEVDGDNDPGEFEGVPETGAGEEWLRTWGRRATALATRELEGAEVRIAVDGTADRRGGFGRLLVYAYGPDGTLFNEALLEGGYARVYETSFSRRSAFEAAQRRAREEGVGVWGYSASATTTDPGTDSDRFAVVEIQADAPGDDHENLDGEYVVFENVGEEPLDLGGWTVADEAGHTYAFPEGTVLDPGERITLYSGSGTDSGNELYWGSDGAIWNNGGDTVYVSDDEGRTVLVEEYSGADAGVEPGFGGRIHSSPGARAHPEPPGPRSGFPERSP